ncbi:hypothetical protein DSECCO2_341490 [anaerobic digester metagenome]
MNRGSSPVLSAIAFARSVGDISSSERRYPFAFDQTEDATQRTSPSTRSIRSAMRAARSSPGLIRGSPGTGYTVIVIVGVGVADPITVPIIGARAALPNRQRVFLQCRRTPNISARPEREVRRIRLSAQIRRSIKKVYGDN